MAKRTFFIWLCCCLVVPVVVKAATPAEIAQWLEAHNTYRQLHGVGPVTWSDTVAASAQAYIDTCPAGHSGTQYGENLAWATYSAPVGDVVTWWYSEEEDYDYNNPGFSSATGHFTQVVWKGTTEIGCAYKEGCTTGMYQTSHTAWICQYNPPGNYIGQFAENVFPPNTTPDPDPDPDPTPDPEPDPDPTPGVFPLSAIIDLLLLKM